MRKLTLVLITILSVLAFGDDRKLSQELRGKNTSDPIEVIALCKVQPTEAHQANVQSHGGQVHATLNSVRETLNKPC